MKPSLLLVAAFGLTLPAQAQAPAFHVQLQVNATTEMTRGSCRVGTGVIGTYPDSPGRLAIGTPVDLFLPCSTAGASFFEARLIGGPGGLQPAGPGALRPLATPVALPTYSAAPRLVPPPPQFQPQPQFQAPPPRQVLIAPTAPVTPRAASPFTAPRMASPSMVPQPMQPLPANPVAQSRPLVIQGAAPVVQGGDTATMRPDAAIVLSFGPVSAARAGTPRRVVLPTDPSYPALLTQLGGIAPGQTKPLPR